MNQRQLTKAKNLDDRATKVGQQMQQIYNGYFRVTTAVNGTITDVEIYDKKEIQDLLYAGLLVKYNKLLKEFEEL